MKMLISKKIEKMLKKHNNYDIEAYAFVFKALDYTTENIIKTKRHVTETELLEGIRQFGINHFGCLVKLVFENWGIKETLDFGKIVFNLIEYNLMGKLDTDKIENFKEVYNFNNVFNVVPVFIYDNKRGDWNTEYVSRDEYKKNFKSHFGRRQM